MALKPFLRTVPDSQVGGPDGHGVRFETSIPFRVTYLL